MNAVEKRVKMCRVIRKMQQFPEYSRTLGLINQSKFLGKEVTKKEDLKNE